MQFPMHSDCLGLQLERSLRFLFLRCLYYFRESESKTELIEYRILNLASLHFFLQTQANLALCHPSPALQHFAVLECMRLLIGV
jgi:hypothetical protein